ncbi:hypothetical protein WMY93_025823 [Mugilogobius chulae]|uniref:TIR domain-containing protein n=1 Tax=Mugilogobius chulae TaxID=88201 RepID=A0AAW0MVR5_9GOBI
MSLLSDGFEEKRLGTTGLTDYFLDGFCRGFQLKGGQRARSSSNFWTYLTDARLSWDRCVAVCTDRAAAMTEWRSGMVAQIKSVNPNIIAMHCMLHGQALAAKDMEPVLHSVLNTAISAVNFVKSRPLQSRLFGQLCRDALLYHSEVRWLLRGKVLQRVFELRKEMAEFLREHKPDPAQSFTDPQSVANWHTLRTCLTFSVVSTSPSKEHFSSYFLNTDAWDWVRDPFAPTANSLTDKAEEQLLELSCDRTLRARYLQNLTKLYLGSNPLKKLSIHSDVFPHLEDLVLGAVSESMVEWDISDKHFLRSLTSLHSYNAEFDIQTYRSLFKLVDWVENLYLIKDELFDEEGHLLMDFNVQSCWDFTGFLCFMSSSALVLLTLLSSFIFHFLRWQLVYGFYLLQAFLYDTKKRRQRCHHIYDAFVSYNVHDEEWVYGELVPELEEVQGWRLCLHHRDFQPGKPIIENITDAIYSSRKTLCVISRRYLQSEWCSREIQMASFRLFDEQKDVLILLFLEEISSNQLSPVYRMRKLVKSRTYLSWTQARSHKGLFWEKVRRALESGNEPGDNHNPLTANV